MMPLVTVAPASPDSLAGQKETCPECGNVVIVPQPAAALAAGAPLPPASRPAPAVAPILLAAPAPPRAVKERVLLRARPAMFRNSPVGFVLCVILIAAFGLGLLILLLWWIEVIGTRLTITTVRTTLRKGILARHVNEVRHADVRQIRVRQDFLQRLFGVGKLELSTAAGGDVELAVSGIPRPRRAAQLVRERQP